MRRWVIIASLLLLAMGGAAMPEAWAGDHEDCSNGQALIKTEPARVIGACRRLAEQGVAFAQFDLGLIYYYGQNVPQSYVEAAKWMRKAADLGDARSQVVVGGLYFNGDGLPQNYGEAMKWYRKAADQGNAAGLSKVGYLYYFGQGVPRNYGEAMKWCRKAADLGDVDAQVLLGGMYALGQGVPQDFIQAHKWWNLAAAHGDANVAKQRDLLARQTTPSQIEKAQAIAAEWKPKTAGQ